MRLRGEAKQSAALEIRRKPCLRPRVPRQRLGVWVLGPAQRSYGLWWRQGAFLRDVRRPEPIAEVTANPPMGQPRLQWRGQ